MNALRANNSSSDLLSVGLKSANMIERLYNHRRLLICIFLAVVTFAVYLPVRNHDFVHYDDDVYVTDNPEVKSGLSWQGIKWAFTTGHGSNWHPLTWLSLMLDCRLFGVKPGPMHIVNVLFHVANTILLFIVLSRMTKGRVAKRICCRACSLCIRCTLSRWRG